MIIKIRKNNMLCLLLLAVIAIVFGFNSAPAEATYSCYGSPAMVNLYAGQALNIGTVTTCTDGNNLYVKYTTNGDWVLTETHLAVATSISSIPQTQTGNPKVGRFPYQATHASVNEYTYVIDLEQANYSEGTQLYIAAHADVLLSDEQGYVACEETAWGDGDGFSGESWATYFTYEVGPPILGPEGGTFEGDGVVVSVPPGATDEYVTINIEVVEEDGLAKDVPPNCIFMGAAKLDIEDVVLSDNADITIPCPSGVSENAEIYVAKVVEYAGTQMFMMVDTATVQGDTITSQDPAFPGILGSGTFVFLWTENVGWVEGQVTNINSGIAVPEAVVTLSGGYWLDIAAASGYYSLPAWASNFVVNAFDGQTGDFGEKQGFMPNDGATVLINVEIGESSGPTQSTLINGNFEDGLTGWVLSGAGDFVDSFGPILPHGDDYMAIISSGDGAIGDASSSLGQSFSVPENVKELVIHYNFISEEYPEYVGSVFNDVMNVTLHTPDGSKEVAFEEVNSATFEPVSGIPCGSGDCTWGQTGWSGEFIDVSQWAGTDDTLTLTVHDVGDTIYDTVVLLDDIFISQELTLNQWTEGITLSVDHTEQYFMFKLTTQSTVSIISTGTLDLKGVLYEVVEPNNIVAIDADDDRSSNNGFIDAADLTHANFMLRPGYDENDSSLVRILPAGKYYVKVFLDDDSDNYNGSYGMLLLQKPSDDINAFFEGLNSLISEDGDTTNDFLDIYVRALFPDIYDSNWGNTVPFEGVIRERQCKALTNFYANSIAENGGFLWSDCIIDNNFASNDPDYVLSGNATTIYNANAVPTIFGDLNNAQGGDVWVQDKCLLCSGNSYVSGFNHYGLYMNNNTIIDANYGGDGRLQVTNATSRTITKVVRPQ
jgi:hypothetical protein